MRSIPSLVIAIAFALPSLADARPPRAPRAPVAPTPPTPPLAPMPPVDAIAFAPPAPPIAPPGMSFSVSFGKGRLGAHVSSMTPELRRFFGAPEDSGLLVQGVETDTPAGKAGVSVGDVIVTIDGDAIDDVGDVAEALADRKGGDVVDVIVIRGKKRRELRAELRDDAGFSSGAFPGGRFHVFGDDDSLRQELEDVRERLESLERALGKKPPKTKPGAGVRPKKKVPKSDPKKT
jgi:hypothetical protein